MRESPTEKNAVVARFTSRKRNSTMASTAPNSTQAALTTGARSCAKNWYFSCSCV